MEAHANNTGYTASLIKNNISDLPIWVFLEIISFGDLTKFYDFYSVRFPMGNNVSKYLWSARIMRNAAAHNSCILNRLTECVPEKKINNSLRDNIKRNFSTIDSKRLKKYLRHPVIQDF